MHNGPLLPNPPLVIWKEALIFVVAMYLPIWVHFDSGLSSWLNGWAGFPEPTFSENQPLLGFIRFDIETGFGAIASIPLLLVLWLVGKGIGARFTGLFVLMTIGFQSKHLVEFTAALVNCHGLKELGSAVCGWQTHSEYLFDPYRIYPQFLFVVPLSIYIFFWSRHQRPFATPVKP